MLAFLRSGSRGDLVATTLITLLWAGFATLLLLQTLSVSPTVWQDSFSYEAVSKMPLLSSSFWAGMRPPLVPLVMRVVGYGEGFTVFQTVVAAIAWAALVIAVGSYLRSSLHRTIAALVILGFGLSSPIAQWNCEVLSESLAISSLVLLFAGFLWVARGATRTRVVLLTAMATCFATLRDTGVITVAFLAIGCLILGLSLRKRALRIADPWRILSVALLSVALVTSAGVSYSGRFTTTIDDVYTVRVFPFPNRVNWFASHGMPDAAAVQQLGKTTMPSAPPAAKIVFLPQGGSRFTSLYQWMNSRGSSTYMLWLLSHPSYDLTAPFVRPELAFNFANGDLFFYQATGWLSFFASPLLWPSAQLLAVLAVVAGLAMVLSRAWRRVRWRITFMFTLVGLFAMLVAWHGDGQETTRHTVEGFAEFRLGLWLLLLFALDSPPRSRIPLDVWRRGSYARATNRL